MFGVALLCLLGFVYVACLIPFCGLVVVMVCVVMFAFVVGLA